MGMGLGSHSYTHANLGKSGANLNREIGDAKSVLESIYGTRLNFFRLPYGSGTRSSRVQSKIRSLGMEHFFWNVDSLDWKKSTPEQIYQRTKKQMDVQGKGILLFHDIHQRTVETTKLLARRLPNLNVIKLEDGKGIGLKANAGSVQSSARDEVRDDKDSRPFAPHIRIIKASALNVRISGEGSRVCGSLNRGDRVEAVEQDRKGWFRIRVTSTSPRPKGEATQHSCFDGDYSKAWISGSATFSRR